MGSGAWRARPREARRAGGEAGNTGTARQGCPRKEIRSTWPMLAGGEDGVAGNPAAFDCCAGSMGIPGRTHTRPPDTWAGGRVGARVGGGPTGSALPWIGQKLVNGSISANRRGEKCVTTRVSANQRRESAVIGRKWRRRAGGQSPQRKSEPIRTLQTRGGAPGRPARPKSGRSCQSAVTSPGMGGLGEAGHQASHSPGNACHWHGSSAETEAPCWRNGHARRLLPASPHAVGAGLESLASLGHCLRDPPRIRAALSE